MHCRGCTATGEWIFGMPQKTITGECRIIDTTSIRLSSTLVAETSLGWSTGMYDVCGKFMGINVDDEALHDAFYDIYLTKEIYKMIGV